MRKHNGFETKREWMSRYEIEQKLTQYVADGWEVLYTIPCLPVPVNIDFIASSTSDYVRINPDGSFNLHCIIVPQPPASDLGFDVGLIRFFDPLPEPEKPCPRCSYPFPDPDRLDREA